MKTFTTAVQKPQLVIEIDSDAESPRAWDNVGFFFTKENRYRSPDGTEHELYRIMIETESEATNTKHHMQLIKEAAHKAFLESGPQGKNSHNEELHIIEIHPVYRYEHGNVVYRRGTAGGFDYSNCGFYIVTAANIEGETHTVESLAKNIDAELQTYTQWCNGEIYRFTLYNEAGELEDSCSGFYDIEDIRGHLPEEWKDEKLEEYLK